MSKDIRAVIFDMDGLLIDSEPFWRKSITWVFNKNGAEMTLDMCEETMGMRIDQVITHWCQKFSLTTLDQKALYAEIVDSVAKMITRDGRAMPGVGEVIYHFEQKQLPMAIASSSPKVVIDAVVNRLGLQEALPAQISAEGLEYGKPHPAVFLAAAKMLGAEATECLVFEDSVAGVIAAKAARMQCVAVPAESMYGDKRFGIADEVVHSLTEYVNKPR